MVALAVHPLGLNGLRIGDVVTAGVEHVEVVAGQTALLLKRKGDALDRVGLPAATVALLSGAIAARVGRWCMLMAGV